MKKSIFLILLLLPVIVFAQNLDISHVPPVNFDDTTKLDVTVNQGAESIKEFYIYTKTLNDVDFIEDEIDPKAFQGEQISIALPKSDSQRISYYFRIVLNDDSVQTLPEVSPALNPYTLQRIKQVGSEGFVLLSPEPELIFLNEEVLISASFFTLSDEINKDSILLFVNGENVTSAATITNNLILYKTKFKKSQIINYYIIADTNSGTQIKSPVWKSRISKIKAFDLPFDYYGDISLTTKFDANTANDSASVSDGNDKYAKAKLDLTIKKNWFRMRTNVQFSSRNTTTEQPVNRYSLSLRVPHLETVFGDHSTTMGQFAFRNHSVNGIYTNLHFRFFRLKMVSGKSEIALKDEFSPTFERTSVAVRTELGSEKRFNLNMTIAKNKDDLESVNNADSTNAEDNFVASTDFMWNIVKNRLTIGAETAVSMYNSRINDGIMSDADLEDYGIDDLPIELEDIEDIIVVNKYLEPFNVSQANMAYKAYLKMYFYKNLLNVSFSEIGPSFNSLSSSSLQKDSRIISVYDAFSFWKNQIYVSGGMNLNSDNVIDSKETTTTSKNIFTNVSLRLKNMPVIGFSVNNSDASNDTEEDSPLFVEQKTNIYNVNVSYKVKQIEYAPTNFSIGYSSFDSEFSFNGAEDGLLTNVSENSNITFSAKSEFRDFPLETYVSFNNQQKSDDDKSTTFNIKSTYKFFDENLTPYIGFKVSSYDVSNNELDVSEKSTRTLFSMGTGYRFFRETYLSTNFYMRNYDFADNSDYNYSNINWDMKVSYKF